MLVIFVDAVYSLILSVNVAVALWEAVISIRGDT